MPRSYGQYDPLAWALDLVGERWSLLIVRDLLLGPRRFTELADRLPGLSRTLLSARLRKLEAEGLVRRAPAAADGTRRYEATDGAWALAEAFAPLAVWGAHRMVRRRPEEIFRAASFALGMAVFADREAARGVRETYEFDVEGERFHLRVDDGAIEPREGPAEAADLLVTLDAETCVRIMRGESPAALVAAGAMHGEGSPEAAARCLAIFKAPPVPASARLGERAGA
ncbi:MAG TPA: winged helix-turn-helix transcriptional regulator [Solirubrobacteraceae bacterium]|nr:winged helix-turn-helix transcriptional regulator [Solirubrobacteraceae bacterium]